VGDNILARMQKVVLGGVRVTLSSYSNSSGVAEMAKETSPGEKEPPSC